MKLTITIDAPNISTQVLGDNYKRLNNIFAQDFGVVSAVIEASINDWESEETVYGVDRTLKIKIEKEQSRVVEPYYSKEEIEKLLAPYPDLLTKLKQEVIECTYGRLT